MKKLSLESSLVQANVSLANKQIELDNLRVKERKIADDIKALRNEIKSAIDDRDLIRQEIEDSKATKTIRVGPQVDWGRGWL